MPSARHATSESDTVFEDQLPLTVQEPVTTTKVEYRSPTKQIETWSLDRSGKPVVDGMGYCECLLNIVSAIRRKVPDVQKRIATQDYKPTIKRSIIKRPGDGEKVKGQMVTSW